MARLTGGTEIYPHRPDLYDRLAALLSRHLGYEYHPGEIRKIVEARAMYALVKQYAANDDSITP